MITTLTPPLDAQVEALLDKLNDEAGHQIYTAIHDKSELGGGYGAKAQKGMNFPDFDALSGNIPDGVEHAWFNSGTAYEASCPFVFGQFPLSSLTDLCGAQAIMCKLEPRPAHIQRNKWIKETTRETVGWGPFKRQVPRTTERCVPGEKYSILAKAGEEPLCEAFWGAYNGEDNCGRKNKYFTYTVIALESDIKKLWAMAKQQPDIVQRLARKVFPQSIEMLLKGVKLKPVRVVENLKEAAEFFIAQGYDVYALETDHRKTILGY